MAKAPSLIHIGLPKTATTALQNHFFPHLGLPYVKYEGAWGKAIRFAMDFEPQPIGARVVTSGEQFSAQGAVGPALVAQRLHRMFGDGIALVVVRDPLQHFISYYRQMVITMLERYAEKRQGQIAAGVPAANLTVVTDVTSIDEYFDQNLDGNLQVKPGQGPSLGISYFSWMDLDRNLDAFRSHFDVMVVDFEMIQTKFDHFKKLVCGRMNIPVFQGALPAENVSGAARLNDTLAGAPAGLVHPDFRETLCEQYDRPKLSEGRANFMSSFINLRCAKTFAAARSVA